MHLYSPPLLFWYCSSFLPPFLFLCFVHCPSFSSLFSCVSVHRRDRCTRPPFHPPLFIFLFGLSGVSCTGLYCSITYGVCLSTDVTGALPPPTSHRTCESVHRRDRFIRTPSSSSDLYFPVAYLFFSSPLAFALVCPSTDVTGALVPAHPLFV